MWQCVTGLVVANIPFEMYGTTNPGRHHLIPGDLNLQLTGCSVFGVHPMYVIVHCPLCCHCSPRWCCDICSSICESEWFTSVGEVSEASYKVTYHESRHHRRWWYWFASGWLRSQVWLPCNMLFDHESALHKTYLLLCWSFLLTRLVGGGVLAKGCVQEEIRFVICPELIAARLFTEALDSTEALLVVGEEYSKIYMDLKDVYLWLQQVQWRYCSSFDLNAPISLTRGAWTWIKTITVKYCSLFFS